MLVYDNHGVRFAYPDIWEIEELNDDGDIVITVSSENTCFWTLRLLPGCPSPTQVVDSCVQGFQEEYPEAEVEACEAQLAEMPAAARDLEFFCMELLNSAVLRCVRTSDFSVLVWWQGTSHELQETRPILDMMTASVRISAFDE